MIGFVEFSYMSKYGHKDIADEDFLEGFYLSAQISSDSRTRLPAWEGCPMHNPRPCQLNNLSKSMAWHGGHGIGMGGIYIYILQIY